MTTRTMSHLFVAILVFLGAAGTAFAQEPGIKRMVLQRIEVPDTAYECVLGMAELPPGTSIGRHTHHGVEVGYIAAGDIELMIEGQETKHLKAGDSYTIPAGTVHDAKNIGSSMGTAMATWVVEKGKPLSQPAP